MTTASDIDLILIFENDDSLKSARRSLAISRTKADWPHDLIFHTVETFAQSVAKGGGASWVAKKEGILLYDYDRKKI